MVPDVPGRGYDERGAAKVQRSKVPSTTLLKCLPIRVFQWMDGPFEKSIWGIKLYFRFGESGSVDMVLTEQVRPGLRKILDICELKDIYNMDETGLFIVCR